MLDVCAAEWWEWHPSDPLTVGIEEEMMLLDPSDWSLAQRVDDVLPRLSPGLRSRVTAETHRGALELATTAHPSVAEAIDEARALRRSIGTELEQLGLRAASAGTHPLADWRQTEISSGERHQAVYGAMRELARREPTFALHVHIGVDDPEAAIALYDRLRAHLPMLLALSANSPFWQGRDTGMASARTPLFQAFPRVGIPRAFGSYSAYVAAVDLLIRSGALSEPTMLWWDVRPQPRFGTVEVRIMDAQTTIPDTAALAALVQSIARLEQQEGYVSRELVGSPELLAENRFLAARDGIDAELVDPTRERLVPARELLAELLLAVHPHAAEIGCKAELRGLDRLVRHPGAARQRQAVSGDQRLDQLVRTMAGSFLD
jgi:carboxylate-amine ligase